MRLPLPNKINSENIDPELQPAVEVVSNVLNTFMDNVTTSINGNIDFDNLAFRLVNYEVIVDSTGTPKTNPELNTGMSRAINGMMCINVKNGGGNQIPPSLTGTPFICFNSVGAGKVKISKVLNLKENVKYILTILVI